MVSFEEVRAEYERRRTALKNEVDLVSHRQLQLAELKYSQMPAEVVLQHASQDERRNLASVLHIPPDTGPEELIHTLRKAGSHSVATFARGGTPVGYEEVASDVARKLGAKRPLTFDSQAELEGLAVKAALDTVLANASAQQREELVAEIAKAQATSPVGLIAASGGLVLANLSGFGLYLAASTSLAAISGAVGVTLPFAVYSGLSSVLAVATGPVGWAVLACAAVYQFGGTNYKKTIPAVLVVAASRSRLRAEQEGELSELARKRKALDLRSESLARLAKFVQEMGGAGSSHSVPRASVPW